MKTRFYRHSDPRRGFKICEQLQIPNSNRLMFSQQIQKINTIYRQCASQHSQAFLSQPNQANVLQKLSILIILPVLLCFMVQDFSYLFTLYVALSLIIGYQSWRYLEDINVSRQRFNEANFTLQQKFGQFQNFFENQFPTYSLALLRQWNQFSQTCIEYIQIYQKKNTLLLQQQELSKTNEEGTNNTSSENNQEDTRIANPLIN